jgi:hypothetical protein
MRTDEMGEDPTGNVVIIERTKVPIVDADALN